MKDWKLTESQLGAPRRGPGRVQGDHGGHPVQGDQGAGGLGRTGGGGRWDTPGVGGAVPAREVDVGPRVVGRERGEAELLAQPGDLGLAGHGPGHNRARGGVGGGGDVLRGPEPLAAHLDDLAAADAPPGGGSSRAQRIRGLLTFSVTDGTLLEQVLHGLEPPGNCPT